ncbi:MAG: carbamoyl-phosphate synthase small chain [Phycisphaerae bacterium]|nr:MAG: glutamine-hydrolyzing carbamoyl-phosphate synthase small subunit [Planctomycetia bacterium]RIK70891.1 MAG: carbamoyl phosphate synthase small subunit [Planctomycetota bacterium]GJQ25027.1 MAG: carbamoyl-phosphate synthase small chain [Phycisphaerae bacterium]
MNRPNCYLGLEDGTVFAGRSFGAAGTAAGEVVFNTAMSGYQEILTDPSYCGQIVTMTAPQIGNYGVNLDDLESRGQFLSGFVVKELSRVYSNQRATGDLDAFLKSANIIGLTGIDTRALTRRLRERGALRGVITTEISDPADLVRRARDIPLMAGQNLVRRVMPDGETVWSPENGHTADLRVVALDCGIKHNILRSLTGAGCTVHVVPPTMSAEAILKRKPHGILAGNGPGDPETVTEAIDNLKKLIGKQPIFGICLGHQLLSLALGAKTYKLKFGHHGANHPVLNHDTGRVEITSQNHGFAVDVPSLEAIGARVTHTNLYDQSLEGFAHDALRVFAVQYHPEAAPGPHDSQYLFNQFIAMMRK